MAFSRWICAVVDLSYKGFCDRRNDFIRAKGSEILVTSHRGRETTGWAIRSGTSQEQQTYVNDLKDGCTWGITVEAHVGDTIRFKSDKSGQVHTVYQSKKFSLDGVSTMGWKVVTGA